ncbi:hypothetical protein BJ138DRAFT_1180678 [Hygrophoropsis aurantiaca]|uniref:Uncharacterized protein n=1 Tax=Hygrophoropsis aurantiaca TaxID=72124 RepID=A0ACB8A9K1_9AGAM|nr:hypothetical protein BJ138DRAFT_1180678 [Hygrophoropsis aurantiaca]
MGAPYKQFEVAGKYLKHKNIKILRLSYGSWQVQIDYDHLKGYNQVEGKRLVTNSHPLDRPENVAFEIGPIVVCLFLLRGVLYHNDIESLLADPSFEVRMRPEFAEYPVFRKDDPGGYGVQALLPMRSGSMGALLKKTCDTLGLGTTMLGQAARYTWRRDLGDTLLEVANEDVSRDALAHCAHSTTLRTNYSRGAGNLDFQGARNGERMVDRNELNFMNVAALDPGVGIAIAVDIMAQAFWSSCGGRTF